MASLSLPARHRAALQEIASLDSDGLGRLAGEITSTDGSEREVREAIGRHVKDENAYDLLVGLTVSRLFHDVPAAEMVADAIAAEGAAPAGDLSQLLVHPAIVRLAKQADLTSAFERQLHTFRILTDIRPVFGEESVAAIDAVVITNTLQLTYLKGSDFTEVYFAVSHEDLVSMGSQISRALDKSAAASRLATAGGAKVLKSPENTR